MKKFIIYWLPLIIWAFIIFGFSSQPYQKQDLRPMLEKHINKEVAEKYFGDYTFHYHGKEISIARLGIGGFIEFFIRKGAHLFEYAVLGMLLFRAINSTGIRMTRVIVLAFIVAFLYAATDEWHQSFTINRTPLFTDVLIDSVGALLGIMMTFVFCRIKHQLRNQQS